jgi:hypothetical protein
MDSIETSDRGTSNQEETETAITCDETNTNMWTPPSKKHSAKTTKQNQDSFRKTDCSVLTQNMFAVLEIEDCVEEQKASAPFAIHQLMETNYGPSPLRGNGQQQNECQPIAKDPRGNRGEKAVVCNFASGGTCSNKGTFDGCTCRKCTSHCTCEAKDTAQVSSN